MPPVTKLASILLVVLALGALQIATSSSNPVQANRVIPPKSVIELPANTGSWQVANYQEAQRGSLFLEDSQHDVGSYTVSPSLTTKAKIDVSGIVARTKLTQRFHNHSLEWVNGLYVFPLPENAALDHLQIQIGERIIEGQIKEKQLAKKQFEQAKKAGKKASYVEQQRPNLFTNSIANIGPNETITVTIEYQQTLTFDRNTYQLRLPLTITPRYTKIEVNGESTVSEHTQTYSSPEVLAEDIRIEVNLHSGINLKNISSDFHLIETEKIGEGEYKVELKDPAIANQDFVLRWQPSLSELPQVAHFRQNVNGKQYGLIMVYPPFKKEGYSVEKNNETDLRREVIFVLDTSGSMSGTSLQQAKQALLLALTDLRPTDRFNIIEFNSYAQNLWLNSKPAELANITEARNFIVNLTANGGTEIASALRLAFDQLDKTDDLLRQVIFITDGSVGNEESLMQLITEQLQDSRLFTVGIGSAPNSYFMTEAAKIGKGTYTYIGSIEQVKTQMLNLLNKLAHPALTDIQIKLNDTALKAQTEMDFYPNVIGDLYHGEPLILSYRQNTLEDQDRSDKKLSLQGRYANEQWKTDLPFNSSSHQSGLNVLWARKKIAQLTRDQRATSTDSLSSEKLAQFKQEITQTALDHHIVSQYTSLIAIDHNSTKPNDEVSVDTQIPNRVPKGNLPPSPLAQLPQTATTAELNMLVGLLLIGGALCMFFNIRKINVG